MTATIRILKKDETTFDSSLLDTDDEAVLTPEQRWNYYVSSYTSLEPTEGTDRARAYRSLAFRSLRAVMRKNGTLTPDGPSNLEDLVARLNAAGDADPARLNRLRSKEALGLRISPVNYRIYWSVLGSEEWWLAGPGQDGQPASRRKNGQIAKALSAGVTRDEATILGDVASATVSASTGENAHKHTDDALLPTTEEAEAKPNAPAPDTEAPTNDMEVEVDSTAAKSTAPKGLTDEMEEDNHTQHDDEGDASAFEEKFVMNNRWMAGLSRDDVEGKNREWRVWRGDV